MTVFQRRRLVTGLVAFALLVIVALVVAIPRIEGDQSAAVEQQLQAAGITGVGVSFSGLDGTITGPAALEETALAAVKDRDGIRSLDYEATTPTAPSGAGTTVAAGGRFLPVDLHGRRGAPPPGHGQRRRAQGGAERGGRERRREEARGRRGDRRLRRRQRHGPDRGHRGGPDQPSAGALNLFSQYLAAVGRNLRQGSVQVAGTTMALDGTSFSAGARDALAAPLEQYKSVAGITVNGGATTPTAVDGAGLQTALNDLVGRAGIQFAVGSATLDASSRLVLDNVAQMIAAGPQVSIEIDGHTDSTGNAAANERMSLQRAQAVAAYLTAKGIAAPRLQPKGFGSTRPIADNATPQGQAQNRRIELVVLGS